MLIMNDSAHLRMAECIIFATSERATKIPSVLLHRKQDSFLLDNLLAIIDYLHTYGNREGCTYDMHKVPEGMAPYAFTPGSYMNTRCILYSERNPLCFEFVVHTTENGGESWRNWFNGGLMYNGPSPEITDTAMFLAEAAKFNHIGW